MKFYLAPLEGVTGYIYRNVLEKHFPGTDRYFTPFIAPDQNRVLRTRETKDVAPENNPVKDLIPQILTNNSEHFLMTVRALQDLGYQEVNLNLGCPSGTVVTKKRGSGFLAFPDELEVFLDEIFSGTDAKISIKTRVGRDDNTLAMRLMEIYSKYPMTELIIHPRTQKEFYRGVPDQDLFGRMAEYGVHEGTEICYNGNIFTPADYRRFTERFPQIPSVMLGRGVIANPGLIRQLKTGIPTDKKILRAFHDDLMNAYREVLSGDKNVIFRMKEIWIYMIHLFADHEKYAKKIRKSQNLLEYTAAVNALFADCELLPDGPVKWNLPQK